MDNIHDSVRLGEYVVIEDGVTIGKNVVIGHQTTVLKGTIIEDNVIVGCNCILGIKPLVNKRIRKSTVENVLVIREGARLGNLVTIYAGSYISKDVFVGDHASIRENTSIGEKTIIGRFATVELNTKIGRNCTIQTQAYITGDTFLEDNVFIGPCVSMANDKYMGAAQYALKGPYIKAGAKIGNNASLLPDITIGEQSIIGAGSVVTKNIPNKITAVGNPAKRLKRGEVE